MLINIKVSSSEQQIADQRKRKAKEKEAKVDWWELRKPPANEFQVYNLERIFLQNLKYQYLYYVSRFLIPTKKEIRDQIHGK